MKHSIKVLMISVPRQNFINYQLLIQKKLSKKISKYIDFLKKIKKISINNLSKMTLTSNFNVRMVKKILIIKI